MRWPREFPVVTVICAFVAIALKEVPAIGQTTAAQEVPYSAFYSQILKDAEVGLRILALVGGAIWAYFKFLKGRTFLPRLEPDVTGQILSLDPSVAVMIKAKLKNTGLSRVDIDHEYSGLKIFTFHPGQDLAAIVVGEQIGGCVEKPRTAWSHCLTTEIFEGHEWIESGETIVDEQLVMLPLDHKTNGPVRLELRLASGSKRWRAVAIVMGQRSLTMKDPIRDSVARQELAKANEDQKLKEEKEKTKQQQETSTQKSRQNTLKRPKPR